MSLTAAEIAIFAANVGGDRLIEGVTLTHPRFDIPVHLTPESYSWMGGDGSGGTITYQPAPLQLSAPGQDQSGLGTLPIRFAATPDVVRQLRLAATLATSPVKMVLRVYVEGDPVPTSVRRFQLTGARVAGGVVSASASIGAAVEGYRWPRKVFRVSAYPGLDR